MGINRANRTEKGSHPYFVMVTDRSDGRHDAAAEQRAAGRMNVTFSRP